MAEDVGGDDGSSLSSQVSAIGSPRQWWHWEAHCAKHLRSVGYTEIDQWRSCFWHEQLKIFLVVYVDDFKLAGPAKTIKKGWDLIRRGINWACT